MNETRYDIGYDRPINPDSVAKIKLLLNPDRRSANEGEAGFSESTPLDAGCREIKILPGRETRAMRLAGLASAREVLKNALMRPESK
jgi:hypothetical protein